MTYRNIRTGCVIEAHSKLIGTDWVPVGEEKAKPKKAKATKPEAAKTKE